MRVNRLIYLTLILFFVCMMTGCWNYREVEHLAIAAGAAVDMNSDGTIHITIEIVNIAGDGQVTYEPRYIESDGETFFEAVRKAVASAGRRIYWSHAKVVVISKEIAEKDVVKYLDFLFRDAEAREDIWLLVSSVDTAKEIIKSKGVLAPIISFELDDTMRSQRVLSRFPRIELFEFFDRYFYEQVSPILPLVHLVKQGKVETTKIEGTAIIKDKKMIGVLNPEETRTMLLLRDEVEGGLWVIKEPFRAGENVTLEIFKSKTKLKPELEDGVLIMKANADITVNIAEIEGSADVIKDPGLQMLKKAAKEQIEAETMAMYLKARDEYNADIFGFGRQIDMKMPQVWNQIKDNWFEYYPELELDVNINLNIRGSATTRSPLRKGQ